MIVIIATWIIDRVLLKVYKWQRACIIQRDIIGEDLRLFCRASARMRRRVIDGDLDLFDQQWIHARQVAEF
jgi:hypothetical protein